MQTPPDESIFNGKLYIRVQTEPALRNVVYGMWCVFGKIFDIWFHLEVNNVTVNGYSTFIPLLCVSVCERDKKKTNRNRKTATTVKQKTRTGFCSTLDPVLD